MQHSVSIDGPTANAGVDMERFRGCDPPYLGQFLACRRLLRKVAEPDVGRRRPGENEVVAVLALGFIMSIPPYATVPPCLLHPAYPDPMASWLERGPSVRSRPARVPASLTSPSLDSPPKGPHGPPPTRHVELLSRVLTADSLRDPQPIMPKGPRVSAG
jgi:hypothetical protein